MKCVHTDKPTHAGAVSSNSEPLNCYRVFLLRLCCGIGLYENLYCEKHHLFSQMGYVV